jgi:hypothetical protein
MLDSFYNILMDPERNALMRLPKAQRFQVMVTLSFLWSVIFCSMAGIMVWLPGYVLVHVFLLLVGIFATSWMFKKAKKI